MQWLKTTRCRIRWAMGTRDSNLQLVMSDSSTPSASQQMVASGELIAEEQPASDDVQQPNVEKDENQYLS